uniref:Uncharacterized protein n=1 Tax=viral metagenome TaxID=1070528 RepID=A0A6M3IVA5_9ZZZZ
MRHYDETQVQMLAAHLNDMAGLTGEYGVKVEPVRIERGVWSFKVTDKVGGNWVTQGTTSGYRKVVDWLRTGL